MERAEQISGESNRHGILGNSRENRNFVKIMGNEIQGVINPRGRDSGIQGNPPVDFQLQLP